MASKLAFTITSSRFFTASKTQSIQLIGRCFTSTRRLIIISPRATAIQPVNENVAGLENHFPDQVVEPPEESQVEEVLDTPENVNASVEVYVVEEEETIPEVVVEVHELPSQVVVEPNTKTEEVPKKSYASIVMDLKQNGVAFSSPAPVPRKPQPRNQEQQVNNAPATAVVAEAAGSG
ncbi:hypothetical protein SSX86_030098 [Deinandra increscens subsp. villosa]|uniref:Uncharacterized protein n=1 Tax=Deinandra increscens subsp. villosa TaxID=3103831 RepID=A0AAP0CAV0_9ASTR